MYLVYLDESYDVNNYVMSALLVPEENWNDAFDTIKNFRKYIRDKYQIPLHKELHARELGSGRGCLRPFAKKNRHKDLNRPQRYDVYNKFMETIGSLAEYDVKAINACIPIPKSLDGKMDNKNKLSAEETAVDRVLNRVQRFCKGKDDYALVIFDQGKDVFYRQIYRKMRVYNPVPSKFGAWEDGRFVKSIPLDRIIADPFFHDSRNDYFIQAADFIAFSLLKREDPSPPKWAINGGITKAFEDFLDPILLKEATENDPLGILRK